MAAGGLPPQPPGVDLSQNKQPLIIAITVATWGLALTMVICRIVGRRMRGLRLWLDDWFIIVALLPALGHLLGMAAYAVSRGLGKHVWVAKPDAVYAWALGLFIAEICYTLTLVSVKLSILSFYWRSFAVRDSIKWPIFVLVSIVCIWGIAVLLVTFLQCLPTRAVWERFNPVNPMSPDEYHCGADQIKFFYGNAIPTIATDLMMLALPVPYIWRLQLPRIQKVALGCVFLVGIFVTIVSIVRFYYLLSLDLTDPDVTWNFVAVGVWSIVEGNIAIVCACLPFLKPIINKISFGLLYLTPISFNNLRPSKDSGSSAHQKDIFRTWGVDKSHGTSTTHVKSHNHDGPETDEHPFAHLTDEASENESARRDDTESIELEDVGVSPPSRGIMVTRNVHQEHQTAP
ncbi:hypothetical protein VFPPC_15712 [Pochonia chlamydosporia 170]|uniref:Rhodopsin domain-containing protein n=1 Tax=Pochonia chlamydosporia 170 TaxID=1380566 RepID=A0A179FR02_METCM|nr:hypothetical protein VFPPC_15712 [Pochonia chlamydosporia 170]OAQ67640.1 hypothetical protein VFPPC_15712 [Pochonia chlamydosporia 170]